MNERRQNADREGRAGGGKAAERLKTEGKYHDRDTDGTDKIDERIKDRVIVDGLDICLAIVVVDHAKTALGLGFGVKELNRLGAGDVFLQKCVQFGVAGTHLVKAGASVFAKPVRRGEEQRDRDERHEGQFPVHPEHYPDDRDDDDQIAEHVDHARREKFVKGVDVARQTGHGAADRILVVVRDLLLLQLGVQLASQVEHHLLPDIVQQYLLNIGEDKAKKEHAEERQREKPDAVSPAGPDKIVHSHLGEIWLGTDQNVGQKGQRQGRGRQAPVRPEISEQTAGDAEVIGFADLVLFVIFLDGV